MAAVRLLLDTAGVRDVEVIRSSPTWTGNVDGQFIVRRRASDTVEIGSG